MKSIRCYLQRFYTTLNKPHSRCQCNMKNYALESVSVGLLHFSMHHFNSNEFFASCFFCSIWYHIVSHFELYQCCANQWLKFTGVRIIVQWSGIGIVSYIGNIHTPVTLNYMCRMDIWMESVQAYKTRTFECLQRFGRRRRRRHQHNHHQAMGCF